MLELKWGFSFLSLLLRIWSGVGVNPALTHQGNKKRLFYAPKEKFMQLVLPKLAQIATKRFSFFSRPQEVVFIRHAHWWCHASQGRPNYFSPSEPVILQFKIGYRLGSPTHHSVTRWASVEPAEFLLRRNRQLSCFLVFARTCERLIRPDVVTESALSSWWQHLLWVEGQQLPLSDQNEPPCCVQGPLNHHVDAGSEHRP